MGDFDLTYFHHELFEHTTHKYNPINISHNLTMNLTMTNEYNVFVCYSIFSFCSKL